MHRRRRFCGQSFTSAIALLGIITFGGREVASAADVAVETILSGLNAPCGIAVRPDSSGAPYELFMAERGAGRVVQTSSAKPGTAVDAISGFAVDDSAASATRSVPGVHGLLFLDRSRLVVAGGGENGTAFLWLYDLAEADAPLKADDRKQDVALRNTNKNSKIARTFNALARTQPNDRVADMLYAVAAGANDSAGLWKVPVRANTLGDAAQAVPTVSGDKPRALGGIAVGNVGYIVVAVVASEPQEKPNEACSLKYLSPIDGRVVLEIPTTLQRIAALAYSPITGNLYAVNLMDKEQGGGVYRVDDASDPGKPACTAVRIAEVDHPTALAFGPQGALYVTVLGDDVENSGALLKLTGEL